MSTLENSRYLTEIYQIVVQYFNEEDSSYFPVYFEGSPFYYRMQSALGAIFRRGRTILLGDPGSGKTTLLRFLAYSLAQANLHPEEEWLANLSWPAEREPATEAEVRVYQSGDRSELERFSKRIIEDDQTDEEVEAFFDQWTPPPPIPIMIELRNFARAEFDPDSPLALWRYLAAQLERDDFGEVVPALQELAKQGQVLFLLDGVDEVTPDDRAAVWKAIAALENGPQEPRPNVLAELGTTQTKLEELLWEIAWTAHCRAPEREEAADIAEGEILALARQPKYLGSPVTYAQFQCFIEAADFADARWWEGMPEEEEAYGTTYQLRELSEQVFPFKNHPRERVSWYQATAFCRWLSDKLGYEVDLPHEFEWEVAARYPDGRFYPWGNEFDELKANTGERQSLGRTSPMGMYPRGANEALALYDLSGNVWEWCRNKYEDPEDTAVDRSGARRVVRGGSWYYNQDNARAASRSNYHPANRDLNNGLRLVRRPPSQIDH